MMLPPPGRRSPVTPAAATPAVPRPSKPTKRDKRMTRRPPQGAMTDVQRAVTPAEEAAFATIEAEMGGRQKLVGVLASAQLPADLEFALALIADPLHDHESLAKVCALAHVSQAKLMKVFQEAAKSRGQLLAITRIAQKLPDVAVAVMEDAIPGIRICPRCQGACVVLKPTNDDPTATAECPECKGLGDVIFRPDHEVQKTALKIGGLLDVGKGGGMNLNILQQNTQHNPGDTGNFDTLMAGLDDLIYGKGRARFIHPGDGDETAETINGEVVNGEDEGSGI